MADCVRSPAIRSDFGLQAKSDEEPLPVIHKRKGEDEEESVEKEGIEVSADCLLTEEKRNEKEVPLSATEKRKLKDEEELVEKRCVVTAADCSLSEKPNEEEGSEASDSEDGDDDDDDCLSDEEEGSSEDDDDECLSDEDVDPQFFLESYWVSKDKQNDLRGLGVLNFNCRSKIKYAKIETRHPIFVKAGGVEPYFVIYCEKEELQARINGLAMEAIHKYRPENGEAYKFRRVINVNRSLLVGAGTRYYITFEAEKANATGSIQVLEAEAFVGFADGQTKIYFCRPELKTLQAKALEAMSKRTLIVAEERYR